MTRNREIPDGENSPRRVGRMWLTIIAAVALLGTALPGCNGPGSSSNAVTAGKVAADGISYYGKEIKISGYVSNPMGGGIFTISDAIGGTAALPILMKGSDLVVAIGEKVVVQGTPTAFDRARIKQDYGIDPSAEFTRGWENRPVVIAGKVQKLD